MYHDPSVGPFRVSVETEFVSRWNATGGFALVVTRAADAARPEPAPGASTPAVSRNASPCDSARRFGDRGGSWRGAGERGGRPSRREGASAPPIRVLPRPSPASGSSRSVSRTPPSSRVRRRSALPRIRTTGACSARASTFRMSRSTRFAAWGRIDEPRIDRIEIVGLRRTRADIANEVIGLRPRDLLTRESLAVAERRIDELPSASGGHLIYQPAPGGRADIVASVNENPLLEPWLILGLRLGGELAARREALVSHQQSHRPRGGARDRRKIRGETSLGLDRSRDAAPRRASRRRPHESVVGPADVPAGRHSAQRSDVWRRAVAARLSGVTGSVQGRGSRSVSRWIGSAIDSLMGRSTGHWSSASSGIGSPSSGTGEYFGVR